ncbi:MAG TPA: DNA gyrase subunit A [bacterium]|nr:DNA gyrase subunit A [bacterium]HMW36667.1 DNA gyrase subunit A [bacterium]HMY35691.1 DNA gyrase subunit A [bacterium]HMZ03564.1 DNA gyrase subunit A [bacterium]HNB56845.1 DNA gyrase subunit A [bacterium]
MSTIEKLVPRNIEDEMRECYIDYSMSVIVSRAIPDVRDGLKPVHRRVLFGMNELGMSYNKPYKKSARIVGEVLGKYHPHGDTAVYDTIVRMAQPFSLRYMLVDGQGNFGSIDGDSPAAMRYTECRLSRIAEEMLRDLEKNTVNFVPNFDDTLKMPEVLPAVMPNLLVNGSTGIAVGMATNIPPHNLTEVVDGLHALIDDPEITIKDLMKHIKGPDFPTAGIINGVAGIKEAYETGRGKIIIRARANIETNKNNRQSIIITELPYTVNKANLVEKISDLVREKKVEDISALRDESDRDGIRVVIELKRDANAQVVMNNLFKHTQMQTTFGIIILALVDGRPMVLNLKQTLQHFIDHRHEVVQRRTQFELEAAERRAHILEGLKIALENIDAIIQLIKKSKDPAVAKEGLMKKYKLSEIQATEILKMQLQRLTNLEVEKIENEYRDVIKLIEKLKGILASKAKRMAIIKDELADIRKTFGDERRTEILKKEVEEIDFEDTIAEEEVVVTISRQGYIKRFPVSGYRRQGRGGQGVSGGQTKDDDFIEHLFVASTHEYIMFFTDKGRCYWLKVYEVPELSKTARGKHISNLIEQQSDEKIRAVINVKEFSDQLSVLMVTKEGVIKRTNLSEYSNPRKGGIIAITIEKNDDLVDAQLTDLKQDVLLGTHDGIAIRFHGEEVREMGRSARGVTGINLEKGDYVVGMVSLKRENGTILVVSDMGYGKRSEVGDYRTTRRGGKGIISMKATDKTGAMIAIREVVDNEDLMIITQNGMVIRLKMADIRTMGRNTQGVRLVKLKEDDTISDITSIKEEESEEAQD